MQVQETLVGNEIEIIDVLGFDTGNCSQLRPLTLDSSKFLSGE